jgi:hypothetical protein
MIKNKKIAMKLILIKKINKINKNKIKILKKININKK